MGKTKLLVFVIDEYGRTLSKDSLHKLISELCEKVLDVQNVDVIAANGPTINICTKLAEQLAVKNISEWEIIYLHGSKYPPVLLTGEDKERLLVLLPHFNGTSAEAIYKVLTDSGAFSQFD